MVECSMQQHEEGDWVCGFDEGDDFCTGYHCDNCLISLCSSECGDEYCARTRCPADKENNQCMLCAHPLEDEEYDMDLETWVKNDETIVWDGWSFSYPSSNKSPFETGIGGAIHQQTRHFGRKLRKGAEGERTPELQAYYDEQKKKDDFRYGLGAKYPQNCTFCMVAIHKGLEDGSVTQAEYDEWMNDPDFPTIYDCARHNYRAEGEGKTRTFKITDIWYDTYDEEYELWDGQEFIDKHGYKQTSEQPDPSEMTITLDEDEGWKNRDLDMELADAISDESGFCVYHYNWDEITSKSAETITDELKWYEENYEEILRRKARILKENSDFDEDEAENEAIAEIYPESFEAPRSCTHCGESGHNQRTCKNKRIPFSLGGWWTEEYNGTKKGFPLVDATHVTMVTPFIHGEPLREENGARWPEIDYFDELPDTTWGELKQKIKDNEGDLLKLGDATYSSHSLDGNFRYLPTDTILSMRNGPNYPIEFRFNYKGQNYGVVLAPRIEDRWNAEGLEFTDWAKQETKHHGKTSLKDWADHEMKKHGKSMSFQDWAKHEDKSHIERYGAEGEPEPYEKIWDDYPEPLEDWEIDALQRDLPPREVALDEGTYEWIQENTTEDAFDGIISHITHWFNKYQKCKEQFGAEESKGFQFKKDSCCCGATKSNPCACMIQGVMECSDTCPCSLWKELREGNWGLNEIGKSKLTPEESERLQIYGAEGKMEDDAWVVVKEWTMSRRDFRNHANDCSGSCVCPIIKQDEQEIEAVYLTTAEAKKGFNLTKGNRSGDWKDGMSSQLQEGYKHYEGSGKSFPMKIRWVQVPIRRFGYDTLTHQKRRLNPWGQYGAEARVGHYLGEDDELLPVGTKVRSYDFPGIDSSYIEGVIEKIAPSPRCSPDCMHYHIRTTKTVRNGKETNEDGIGEIFMTHPYEDFGWELKLSKRIQVMDAESFEAQAPRGHKMMTAALGKKIPPLYSQDGKGDEAIVYAHYFNPYGIGEWWILEWDGKDEMFGYADLGFPELGYISLSELENVSIGGMELPIERDLHWREKTLGEVKQAVSKYRAESFGAEDHDWEWGIWWEDEYRWICKKCEKSYFPPYPQPRENLTTKGKRKPHKKGCKGQPDPHWLEGKTLKKDGVEKIHDMDEAYYIASNVIFYHDPKNNQFHIRDDEMKPLEDLMPKAKELEKDGFPVEICEEWVYHPTGEEDEDGDMEYEFAYTTPCGNCDEELSWRFGSEPIFDEDRKVWLHSSCVEGDTESFGAEDEQINIDGQPYIVALGYNYIDNRDGNVGLDYFGLAHNEKDIEGLEKLAIETGKEESEKGEIVGMFLEWEPLCPHLPHEDYSSCPECERGWGIEYGPRYITPCVKCGWDILDNHPYASVFDLDIYVDNLGKYGEKGNLVHLHCATNADVSDEIWDNEGGQFIGKEPDFTKRKIEWGAESFSAPKGKGINLFIEPFEEMPLDSGNIKKVIVGLGIGITAILAYNKWK